METSGNERVADSASLPEGGRLQLKIKGRYITVIRLDGKVFAIDSVCFHAGGPLGIGDIEDVNGRPCIVCPWHYYKIDVETGDKYYQQVKFENGKMVQGDWASNGVKQRVHAAEERDGGIYLTLSAQPSHVDSDEYACSAPCGDRVLSGGNKGVVRRGSGSMPATQNVGGDGRLPSGAVIKAAREAAQMSNPGAVGGGAALPGLVKSSSLKESSVAEEEAEAA